MEIMMMMMLPAYEQTICKCYVFLRVKNEKFPEWHKMWIAKYDA